MPQVDLEKIGNYIREVAAEKITPRFRQLEEHEISTKTGPTDLVTIADLEAEEDLTRIFKDIIVGSLVVGEEAVSKNEMDMGVLGTEDGYIWVIDPVDGTSNFAAGDEKHGTIVALVKNQQTIASWIYDVPKNRMVIAEQGSGVELEGVRKTFPQSNAPLNDMRGFISRKFLPKKMREELKDVLDIEFGNIETYMCCAHEYMDIIAGKAFFSMYSRIRPWDHLAGGMVMSEAGGHVRKWDGSPYGPGDEQGGIICAQDEETWQKIYDFLLDKYLIAAA